MICSIIFIILLLTTPFLDFHVPKPVRGPSCTIIRAAIKICEGISVSIITINILRQGRISCIGRCFYNFNFMCSVRISIRTRAIWDVSAGIIITTILPVTTRILNLYCINYSAIICYSYRCDRNVIIIWSSCTRTTT